MTQAAQWEYRVETFGTYWNRPKEDVLQATLDEWGEDGWEVVSTYIASSGEKVTVVAKRPLSVTVRRRRSWPS